jgi:hypothetical protein
MDREEKIAILRAEFETLDDTQKDHLVGIAKALSFAHASDKAAVAIPPPGPDGRGTEGEGQRR